MTPEEFLVPVILITKDDKKYIAGSGLIDFKIINPNLQLNEDKNAIIKIALSAPADELHVKIGNVSGACKSINDLSWEVTFSGLSPGKYLVDVYPNNIHNQTKTEVVIEKKGIIENDLF